MIKNGVVVVAKSLVIFPWKLKLCKISESLKTSLVLELTTILTTSTSWSSYHLLAPLFASIENILFSVYSVIVCGE